MFSLAFCQVCPDFLQLTHHVQKNVYRRFELGNNRTLVIILYDYFL